MEAQRSTFTLARPLTSSNYLCDGCGTRLPFSYSACLRCGAEVPALVQLRRTSLRLRLMVNKAQARQIDQDEEAPAETGPTRLQMVMGSPVKHRTVVEAAAFDEAPAPAEPIQLSAVRAKRAWLKLPFMRKAS